MSLPDIKPPDKQHAARVDRLVAGLVALWLCLCVSLVAAVVIRLQFMWRLRLGQGAPASLCLICDTVSKGLYSHLPRAGTEQPLV